MQCMCVCVCVCVCASHNVPLLGEDFVHFLEKMTCLICMKRVCIAAVSKCTYLHVCMWGLYECGVYTCT